MKRLLFFAVAALAELVGCYLPWLWLREGKSPWLLVPGALALVAFVWLLAQQPAAGGRTYAVYGGIYIVASALWAAVVDRQRLDRWDVVGFVLLLTGAFVMTLARGEPATSR